jgi:hypothetical protein
MNTRPTAAARAVSAAKKPAASRSSWRQALRWALFGAVVVTGIALVAGVGDAPAPSPAAATQPPPAATGAKHADESPLDPALGTPPNARASRTPPSHPR